MSTHVEERVSRLAARPKPRRRSFGLSGMEIGLIILALIVFILAIFYYYTALGSVQSKLRTQEQELQRITDELTKVSPNGPAGTKGPNVKETLASLESFKSDYLKPLGAGHIALFNEVNALAKKHSVVLTSGIDMPIAKNSARTNESDPKAKKKTEEVLNAFPHVDIHFTVFGQYPNMRAFLNELEHSRQFVVIKMASFTMIEEKGEGGGRRSGRINGSGLTMTIEASAYFEP